MAVKLELMVMLMSEIMMAAIKLKAMMEKAVAKKKEEAVLCIFLRCPTYCEALTRSQRLPLSASSSRGLYAEGPSEYSFPPLSSISYP